MKRAPLPQNTDSSALVEPAHAPFVPSKPSRGGALVFGFVLAAAVFALTLTICYFGFGVLDLWSIALALVLGVLAPMTMHISMEWERLVIFRFGAFNRVAGPGLVFMIPVVEQVACQDRKSVV